MLLPLLLGSCAAAGNSGRQAGAITVAEMDAAPDLTVLEAVTRLRPQWLSNLKGGYRNGASVPMRELQGMPVFGLSRIERITADEATARYGTRVPSGWFLVLMPEG